MTKQQKKLKPKHLVDSDDFLLGIDKIGIGIPDLGLGPSPENWEDDVAELNKKKKLKKLQQ
jgi:hypothetical protein